MDQDENDIVLVERVQNGDKQAFNLLVQNISFELNISQSVCKKIRMNKKISFRSHLSGRTGQYHGFVVIARFITWLYRIAVNTSKNYWWPWVGGHRLRM